MLSFACRARKRCIRWNILVHTLLTDRKEEITATISLLLPANHSQRINHSLFPACFREYGHLSKPSLVLTRPQDSLVISPPLSLGFNGLIDFTRQLLGIIISVSYSTCNCTVLTYANPRAKQVLKK